MIGFILFFLLGDCTLQFCSTLPSINIIIALFFSSFIFFFIFYKYPAIKCLLFAFALGFIYTDWYAAKILSFNLPKEIENQSILIKGEVASLPEQATYGQQFLFLLQTIIKNQKIISAHTFLLLTWPAAKGKSNINGLKTIVPTQIRVGDEWQLIVRLKRIHSLSSPNTFDFSAWAIQHGIRAQGYVVPSNDTHFLSHHSYHFMIDQLRQKIKDKLKLSLPASHASPWLLALMLGDQHEVAPEDWEILRETGTNHLMAIAGLHLGMVAAIIYFLINRVWRRIPYVTLYFPAQYAASISSLFAAFMYSVLAGFSLPCQRALIMFCCLIVALLSQKKFSSWSIWSCALFLVLIVNPLNTLSTSFWLSFYTIALIIMCMQGRLAIQGWWWKWGRIQWIIAVGLIPLTLFIFQECSLVSFIANSIAIPFLGFFILPFCLLSIVFLFMSQTLTQLCLFIANKNLTFLWIYLRWGAQYNHLCLYITLLSITSLPLLLLTTLSLIILLLPRGIPGKTFGLILLLPFICDQTNQNHIKKGDLWVNLLDVGQGLSVVIQTHSHLLVYDTGSKLNANSDMGERVVLPFLKYDHYKKIDMLVISHGDNDHIGGAKTLQDNLTITSIKTSVPDKINTPVTSLCLANDHWMWDEINFTFLYPTKEYMDLDNDSSCVLRIDNGETSILLPGDIEKFAEKKLLSENEHLLSTNILIAPHHGSKTSAQMSFITHVHPQYVLYSTGYLNRYHFPHPSVVKSYDELHVTQLNTAVTGTMQFKIEKSKGISQILLYRNNHHYYWMD